MALPVCNALLQRAQIVLLAAQGFQNKDIAEQLGVGCVQVARWRERFLASGLQGLEPDLQQGALPAKVDVAKPVSWAKRTADILQKIVRPHARLGSKQNDTLHGPRGRVRSVSELHA